MNITALKTICLVAALCMLTVSLAACGEPAGESLEKTTEAQTLEIVTFAPNYNVSDPDASYGNNVGDMCIPVSLEKFSGGSLSVSENRGKITILNFWGEWCGYCIQELPAFDRVASEYASQITVMAVHSIGGMTDGIAYANENYKDSKIVFLKDAEIYGQSYYELLGGNGSYPRTIILDRYGKIIFSQYGAMSYDALVAAIKDYV